MFQRLLDHDIKLNSCKAFLSFSSVALLKQHVNEFDLYAVKDKIAVILNWDFLSILKTRLTAELNFEHVEQPNSIQISSRTWFFVRRIESSLICCSTFEFDSYKLFEILD
jgi:hypothetical protein